METLDSVGRISSWITIILLFYAGYLFGRIRAPTLTKYANRFKIHYYEILKTKRKLNFANKLMKNLLFLQVSFFIISCIYVSLVCTRRHRFWELNSFLTTVEELLQTLSSLVTMFKQYQPFRACILSLPLLMKKSYFFTVTLLLGVLSDRKST